MVFVRCMHLIEIVPCSHLVGIVGISVAERGVGIDGTRIIMEVAVIDEADVVQSLLNLRMSLRFGLWRERNLSQIVASVECGVLSCVTLNSTLFEIGLAFFLTQSCNLIFGELRKLFLHSHRLFVGDKPIIFK